MNAGTTVEGFAAMFGLLPLVIVSVAGIIFAQLLFDGELFEMGLKRYNQGLPGS